MVVAVASTAPPKSLAVTVTPAMASPLTVSVTVPAMVPVVGADTPGSPSEPALHPATVVASATASNAVRKGLPVLSKFVVCI